MDSREKLLAAFEKHREKTGLKYSTISTYAANDGKFYDSIKAGGNFTNKRFDKIIAWFKDYRPKK